LNDDPLTNAASQMYAARVQGELHEQPELYKRNPEAQQFYFKGIEDVLTSIAAIRNEAPLDPRTMAIVLEALHAEVTGTTGMTVQ